MKLTNYRREDIETVVEAKKMVLHQLEVIEICNWTDDIEEAIIRTETALSLFQEIRRMKLEKSLGTKVDILAARLIAQGINAQAMRFTHKKAD